MFISSSFLGINYGVDDKIGKFFVDRQPPANNLYWKDKLMYLRPEPGWLFIPLIVDLLYKTGIDRQQLTSEAFVGLMEQIGHISAEEEMKMISREQAHEKYILLVKDKYENEAFFTNLKDYMAGGTNNFFHQLAPPYKALRRGDAFLFSLCALSFDETLQEKVAACWFALISTLLLLDDAEDVDIDKKSGEENAIIESGMSKQGMEDIKELVAKNLRLISSLNRPMALKLDASLIALLNRTDSQQLLN